MKRILKAAGICIGTVIFAILLMLVGIIAAVYEAKEEYK